jgi:3-mercaptopyruvate sulfurtransferase SseA
VSPEEPVYLLCHSGVRADLAAQKLTAAGFQQPVVVQGGTVAWTRSGLPVERDSRPLLTRTSHIRPAALTLAVAALLLAMVNPWFLALAAAGGVIFAAARVSPGRGQTRLRTS